VGARARTAHPHQLARALGCSQPLVSKHLRILRAAGLVGSHNDPHDRRARIYDIRREQFTRIENWLQDIERNYQRRHRPPADPDIYSRRLPNPDHTTRGTPRQRIPRALKDPWERGGDETGGTASDEHCSQV
jgi:predicted transcriptional regulator